MSKILFVFIVLASLTFAEHSVVTPGGSARRVATKLSVRDFAKKVDNEKTKDFYNIDEVKTLKLTLPELNEVQELLGQLATDKWKEPLKVLIYKFINVVPDISVLEKPLLKAAGKTTDEAAEFVQKTIKDIKTKKQRLDKHYDKLADLLGFKENKVKQIEDLLKEVTKDDNKLYTLVVGLKRYPRSQREDFINLLKETQQYNPVQDTEANKLNRQKMLIGLQLANGGNLSIDTNDKDLSLFAAKAVIKIDDYAAKNEEAMQKNYLDKIAINDKGEIIADATAKEKFKNIFSHEYSAETMGDYLKTLLGKDKTTVSVDKAKKALTYFVNKEGDNHYLYFIGRTDQGDEPIRVKILGELSYDKILKAYDAARKDVETIFPVTSLPLPGEGRSTVNSITIK